jgi:hypothetical protein
MIEISVPCGTCGKPVRGGDEFCEACGTQVSAELKRALNARRDASDTAYAKHNKQVKEGQQAIGMLSILFVLGGVVFFFVTRSQVEDALQKLSAASASAPINHIVQGATTVGELRALLERQPWQVLGLNLFLAAVMVGLWVWSKRAVLPAILTALGIYVTVQVASLLFDPATIAQGIIMKVIVIAALVKGVKSALEARKLELAR